MKRKKRLEDLVLMQNNICLICENEFGENLRPCLDHCHKSNEVRGALCYACNTALGKFKEDKKILERAIKYLDDFAPMMDFE